MIPASKGLGAVTIFVEDLPRAKVFYQDVFGLSVLVEDETAVALDFHNTIINLLRSSAADELIAPSPVAPPGSGSRFQFTIWVDDTDAACAELDRLGVALINGPIDRVWGQRTATFSDPDGTVWELAQSKK